MSRRGQKGGGGGGTSSQAATSNTTGGDNVLMEGDPKDRDSILGNIQFGINSILKVYQETVAYMDEDEGIMITDRLEENLLQLLQSELVYLQTSDVVNQVVEELALQDNSEMDAKQFADSVDSINELANQRLQEYKATLTPNILRGHPKFLDLKVQMEKILAEEKEKIRRAQGKLVDNADAETEAEEVDLDDSAMDEDDGDEGHEEVIPELDPISKQPLRDPCRNKLCRHIYGRAAMVQVIKKNPRTRCPFMGCDNEQFVKVSHLEDDPFLTAKVLGQPPPQMSPRKKATTPSRGKARRGRRRY